MVQLQRTNLMLKMPIYEIQYRIFLLEPAFTLQFLVTRPRKSRRLYPALELAELCRNEADLIAKHVRERFHSLRIARLELELEFREIEAARGLRVGFCCADMVPIEIELQAGCLITGGGDSKHRAAALYTK